MFFKKKEHHNQIAAVNHYQMVIKKSQGNAESLTFIWINPYNNETNAKAEMQSILNQYCSSI